MAGFADKPETCLAPAGRGVFLAFAILSRIAVSKFAVLVELVDTPDLGSGGVTCPSSSLGDGTKFPEPRMFQVIMHGHREHCGFNYYFF